MRVRKDPREDVVRGAVASWLKHLKWHLLWVVCEALQQFSWETAFELKPVTRTRLWLSEHPSRNGIQGLMEHHLGAILGCSDLHEGDQGDARCFVACA